MCLMTTFDINFKTYEHKLLLGIAIHKHGDKILVVIHMFICETLDTRLTSVYL